MKLKLLLFLLLFSSYINGQNFHDTQGKLEISNNGQSVYTLPVAMPPSIKDVGPIINLIYSSGQNGGIAGQGWNISTISTINRISTRPDIDGFRDGVDFDNNDKLALDGQRLLLKSGAYWADGSTYETEVQSNQKIELIGSGTTMYFIVTSPDGSRTWYGNYGGMNATDATAYYVVRYEDMHRNFITYHYAKPLNKSICVTEIRFSANTVTNPTPLNKIVFTYKTAIRKEYAYIKGSKIEKAELLDKIEVFTNSLLFKSYVLTHSDDTEGYQRVTKIQEFNSASEPANPVEFEYRETPSSVSEVQSSYNDALDLSTSPDLSGDFDGDGKLDFVSGAKLYTKLFQEGGNVYTLPFIGTARQKFTATTLTNNKLNQKQSLVYAKENLESVDFRVYNQEGNSFVQSYNKIIPLDNMGYCYDNCTVFDYDEEGHILTGPGHPVSLCSSDTFIKNSNKYIEGDFNGDGISEVLVLSYYQSKVYQPIQNSVQRSEEPGPSNCELVQNTTIHISGARIVDLNPSSPIEDNSYGNFALLGAQLQLLQSGERYVMDFNADGKSDILVIEENKNYRVINFKQMANAPWVELEVIGQGVMEDYIKDKQLLFGDYNGDGKLDVMMPNGTAQGCSGCVQWHIYYSNPQIAGGVFFTKETHNAAEYWAYTGNEYESQWHTSNYYAMDVNKDGKSDLVRVWTKLYQPDPFWDPQNINSQWFVEVYLNNVGLNGGFSYYYQSPTNHANDDNSRPFSLASNFKYKGLDCELLVLRYHGNNSFEKTVTYIDFKKDFNQENLLEKVTQSEGGIVDRVYYETMVSSESNNGFGNLFDFYSSTESLYYPFVEIKQMPTNYLVKKISNTSAGVQKSQDFIYHGLGINMNGLGFVGFKKTARSGWYVSENDKKTWNVSENDLHKRAALICGYVKEPSSNLFSFESIPSGYITLNENSYSESIDPVTKRYTILLATQRTTNTLTGVVTQKNYNSYSNDNLLPLSETTNNYIGTILHGSATVINDYWPSSTTGIGVNYHIGRPKEVTTTKTVYVDTVTGSPDVKVTNEKYEYTNGNLTRIEKKANNDTVTLVEVMNYFSTGLLKNKTMSATGTTSENAVSPRTVSYTYDSTNRFIKTETNAEGRVTTYVSYHPVYGLPLEVKNSFNQSTKNIYDNWGKRTKVTDFLNKNINYTYSKINGNYTTLQVGDDDANSMVESDALAREVKKGAKDINGNWVYISTEFDYLGRKIKESEPYFGSASPNQWTTFEYDDFSRPTKTTKHTGKIITTTYDGLIVSSFDSVMSKSKTLNANGVVISATDFPGGTINYKYDANGNLVASNYDGVETTAQYDNWGRKTQLVESSAGTYTYKYNAFGEILLETTPKGTTNYTLNAVGKVLTKVVSGDGTSITSTYTYDPTNKWLTNIAVINPNDGNSNYAYTYDTVTKQLNKTIETLYPVGYITAYATFTKQVTFDLFGRVSNETNTAVSHGKTSSKTVTHTYKNGLNWQIKDGTTILWQVNSTSVRGQLTGASLGNGIAVNNAYDNYGYHQQIKHDLGATNIMTLNTTFEPVLGNLESRYSSLFNLSETFEYDELDRLNKWKSDGTTILNLQFNSGVEGFVTLNGSGSFANYQGKLKVNAYNYDSGVKREITNNSSVGTEFTISFDYNRDPTNGIVHAKLIESDPVTGEYYEELLGTLTNGMFQTNYTTQYYPKLEIAYYVAELEDGGIIVDPGEGGTVIPTSIFTVDNFIVKKNDIYEQNYDVRGRITQNELGLYQYENNDKPYQNTSVNTTDLATSYYQTRPLQNISYNAFKAPINIEEQGVDVLSFGYNAFHKRSIMYYGNTNSNKLDRPYRKYYSQNGNFEVKVTFNAGNTSTPASVDFIMYIGGDAYTAPIVLKSNGTTQKYFYLHRDYQGSILAVTSSNGVVVEKRLFDPWGAIKKVQDGSGNILTKLTFFDRGYTGHEHLESVGLINMNGRIYDPKLHRFLQPDNFVQDTYNTQNYNRYGYCLNNPFKYTDPSGEVIEAVLIGAGVGLFAYFTANFINDQPITLKGALTATFVGALSGAVTFGIGEWTNTISTFAMKTTTQALAHGLFQGTLSGIQGGGFWAGFASGSLSSIASSLYVGVGPDNAGWHGLGGCSGSSKTGMIIFGSVMGGAGASLTGGNFWRGAVTGLIVSGLNHSLHDSFDSQEQEPTKEKKVLSHEDALEFFKKEFESYEEIKDLIDSVIDWTGDYAPIGVVKDLLSKSLTYSPYALFGTQLSVESKTMDKAFKSLYNIREKYLNLHAKDASSLKGVTIEIETYVYPAASYSGGMGKISTYYKIYDNYTKTLLGQYETTR
ncbi:MAG: VCBS repeat-containing protein [Flavobacteriales bacterium]|nr:VCBS repeat-containing protein [Flavobacteriales bacterium]